MSDLVDPQEAILMNDPFILEAINSAGTRYHPVPKYLHQRTTQQFRTASALLPDIPTLKKRPLKCANAMNGQYYDPVLAQTGLVKDKDLEKLSLGQRLQQFPMSGSQYAYTLSLSACHGCGESNQVRRLMPRVHAAPELPQHGERAEERADTGAVVDQGMNTLGDGDVVGNWEAFVVEGAFEGGNSATHGYTATEEDVVTGGVATAGGDTTAGTHIIAGKDALAGGDAATGGQGGTDAVEGSASEVSADSLPAEPMEED